MSFDIALLLYLRIPNFQLIINGLFYGSIVTSSLIILSQMKSGNSFLRVNLKTQS